MPRNQGVSYQTIGELVPKEKLYCEAGHHWLRKTVRGRKPTRCPEHKITVVNVAKTAKPNSERSYDYLSNARQAKKEKSTARQKTEDAQVVVWLGWLTDESNAFYRMHQARQQFGMKSEQARLLYSEWATILTAMPTCPNDDAFKRHDSKSQEDS